jgi:Fic family protein
MGELQPISGTDPKTQEAWSYWSFIPNPLPIEPRFSMPAFNAAANAAMDVARLDQAMQRLPNPEILVRPIVRREAQSTSALEGTYTTLNEVLEADFVDEDRQSAEQREVLNYVRATELAMELLKTYPICRTVLGQLQHAMVRGTEGETYDAGDIRKRQVAIGPKNRPIKESRFVPPPNGPVLEELFSDWEKWVNAENDVPIIVKMALAHYQFETMHPYADGNGRVGRLVALLQLMQAGVLRLPILNLSPWLEENRDQYMNELLEVSKTGDFNAWISFFSRAVSIQAQEGVGKIGRLIELRDEILADVRKGGHSGAVALLAENIIGYPVIDVSTASIIIGKTFETANQAVRRLVNLGYLREITGGNRNRLFVCFKVFEIIR